MELTAGQKKRLKERAKKEREREAEAAAAALQESTAAAKAASAAAAAAASAVTSVTPALAEAETVDDVEKSVRKIEKKLRQIDALRSDAAAAGTRLLTPDQVTKLNHEAELRVELSALTKKLAEMRA